MKNRYMMATTAIHKLGDISRRIPDLCVIHGENEENYIGNWLEGFGFVDVEFPKKSTRELTEEEKNKYNGMVIAIGNSVQQIVETKENIISCNTMKVVTKNSIYHFGEAGENGVRTISRDGKPFDFKHCVVTFLAVGKSMRFCEVGGSGRGWTTSKVLSIE